MKQDLRVPKGWDRGPLNDTLSATGYEKKNRGTLEKTKRVSWHPVGMPQRVTHLHREKFNIQL